MLRFGLIVLVVIVAVASIKFVLWVYKKRYNDFNPSRSRRSLKLDKLPLQETDAESAGGEVALDLNSTEYETFTKKVAK